MPLRKHVGYKLKVLCIKERGKKSFIPEQLKKTYLRVDRRNDMKKKFLRMEHAITVFAALFTALFLTISLSSCNLMRGAGKDIENAGGSIQRTVDHND